MYEDLGMTSCLGQCTWDHIHDMMWVSGNWGLLQYHSTSWYQYLQAVIIMVVTNSLAPGRCGWYLNSLAPRRFERNFRKVIFKLILVIDVWGISCEIVLTWMPQDLTDDKSSLVQVMAWCCQATSHYLNQCWPSSLSPYSIIRPQWIKLVQTHINRAGKSHLGKKTA